mmetsp:Transcript_19463/g.32729  ORF Transcript_19463/g.32729 Transcript_19463/m.32729 type:complete len:187 (+) Transcript_19463:146-706(+)
MASSNQGYPLQIKKFNPFETQRRKEREKQKRQERRQYSDVEKSIISSTCYPYSRDITLKSEYPPGAQPLQKIPVVLASKEGLNRQHDLIVMVPGDKGSNRFSVGKSICIGTFPDRRSAKEKRKELMSEYSGKKVSSPSAKLALDRPSWDVGQEILIRPSFLMQEDLKRIKTGNITSRKNCECPFRC